jgi:hypothetical protein
MTAKGQTRRFDRLTATSDLPQPADIAAAHRLVRFVPIGEASVSLMLREDP